MTAHATLTVRRSQDDRRKVSVSSIRRGVLSRLINGALILELSEPKIILQNLDPSYR
jgi:hypothetical protein